MPAESRVWVGGLPSDIKDQELKDVFNHCGKITDVTIKNSKTDTFAFLTFEGDKYANVEAMKSMDGSKTFGRPIKVNYVIENQQDSSKKGGSGKGKDEGKSWDDSWDDRGKGGGGGKWYETIGRNRGDDGGWNRERGRADSRPRERSRGARREPPRDARDYNDRDSRPRERSRGARREPPRDARDYNDRDSRNYEQPRGNPPGRDIRGSDRYRDEAPPRDRYRYDDRDVRNGQGRSQGSRDEYRDQDGRDGGRRYETDYNNRWESPERKGGKGFGKSSGAASSSRIWVGGLPKDVTEGELEREFGKFGPLTDLLVRQGKGDTFAFVEYRKFAHAEDAIFGLNQSKKFGTVITVSSAHVDKGKGKGKSEWSSDHRKDWSRSPPPARREKSPARRERSSGRQVADVRQSTIMLENLPGDMVKEELHDVAANFGTVIKVDIWPHKDNQTKHGTIEYQSRSDIRRALDELDGRKMQGWDLKLKAHLLRD